MRKRLGIGGIILAAALSLPFESWATCTCALPGSWGTNDAYTPTTRQTRAQACNTLYSIQLQEAENEAAGYCTFLGAWDGLCSITATHDIPCFMEDGTYFASTHFDYVCKSFGIGG